MFVRLAIVIVASNAPVRPVACGYVYNTGTHCSAAGPNNRTATYLTAYILFRPIDEWNEP